MTSGARTGILPLDEHIHTPLAKRAPTLRSVLSQYVFLVSASTVSCQKKTCNQYTERF